jgi:hypothetical protein
VYHVCERTTSIGRVAANTKSSLGGQRSDHDTADPIGRIPGAARNQPLAMLLGSTSTAALSLVDGLMGGLMATREALG